MSNKEQKIEIQTMVDKLKYGLNEEIERYKNSDKMELSYSLIENIAEILEIIKRLEKDD